MVPYPVMLGFVNGLAVVIFIAQFNHFKVMNAEGASAWLAGPSLHAMLYLVALTVAIIYIFPKVTKAIPSTLAAIIFTTAVVFFLGIDTKTVGDLGSIAGGIPEFNFPLVPINLETFKIILPYAFLLASIGLIESLLTLNLIDDMTDSRGKPNKESMAQGIGNVVTGFFGGMGGCAMIGQSMININNGAVKRLSGIATAIFLASFVLFLSDWIEMIPLAALIGVMFVVAEKTFEWGSLRLFGKVPQKDIFVGLLVGAVTIIADLAIAVMLGVIVSALIYVWEHAKFIEVSTSKNKKGWKIYELKGALFFASVKNFNDLFTIKDDPNEIIIDFKLSKVADHSALMAIGNLANKYKLAGKNLRLINLSENCIEVLDDAKNMIEINILQDIEDNDSLVEDHK